MFRIALVVALGFLALPLRAEEPAAPGAEPPAAAAGQPAPRAEQHTTVQGTPPADLVGRWLALATLDLPNDKKRAVPYFWEIVRADGSLALNVHFVWPPDAQKEAMREANRTAGVWKPLPEDLTVLREAWNDMKPWGGVPRVDVELRGIGAAKGGADALWDATIVYTFAMPSGVTVRQSSDYTARAAEAGTYSGPFETTVDMPVPTRMGGTFVLYRLDEPKRGFFARFSDLLSGCGR